MKIQEYQQATQNFRAIWDAAEAVIGPETDSHTRERLQCFVAFSGNRTAHKEFQAAYHASRV